ncbi:MAG: sigma-70 family RNA polymerase sigma factor [Balneolaceae bacterium]
MDYTPLVIAIQEGDEKAANRLISEARPILIRMLKVRMNASQEDAEDAVQMMFLYVIRAIQEDRIENPSGLLSYMIITCRHNYLKRVNGFRPDLAGDMAEEPVVEATQLSRLIDEEKQQLYERCIRSLKKKHREFFEYWLSHPDDTAAQVAEVFGISEGNAWTRKHRIIKMLKECVQKKQ